MTSPSPARRLTIAVLNRYMKRMKRIATILLAATLGCGGTALAQNDPTIMTVNGKPVTRSEFEYSYNKNNNENVIDRKSVKEYVELFINYKLKVEAALDAHLDTLSSFKKEFTTYRDQQIRPSLITQDDVEAEARKIYADYRTRVDYSGGLVKAAHILVMMRQKATPDQLRQAKLRIDSIYKALQGGADFAETARRCSDDKGSAQQGGELPWIEHGQTLKEFEDQVYALKPGQMSRPFESPAGWHIVLLKDKRMCFPYDSLRTSILSFIERRGLKDAIINQRVDSLARLYGAKVTPAQVMDSLATAMEARSPQLRYLVQEYHDGLLLFEMSNRTVWDKAQKDEAGQQAYFDKNRKKYQWAEPRFKGIAYHTRTRADVKAVKAAVKGVPFDHWAETLRTTFNKDSVLRIRVEKGIFAKGDNPVVDNEVFKTGKKPQPLKDFPFDAVYGKRLKVPETIDDVRSLVLADYQEQLEREWVDSLRRKYGVTVNDEVVKTVNNHH